jgi:uncharacterized protein (TIGR02646 family)
VIRLDRAGIAATAALTSARTGLQATVGDAPGKAFVATRSRYAYTSMQPRLTAAQRRKCAYCEDYLRTRMIEVDHIRPKDPSKYWWLAYSLENLVATCRSCNNAKSNKWRLMPGTTRLIPREEPWVVPEPSMLVDPTVEDPDDHITYVYAGGLWRVAALTRRGRWTIDSLELDRDSFTLEANEFVLDAVDPYAKEIASAKSDLDRARLAAAVAEIKRYDLIERRWTQMIRVLIRHSVAGTYSTPILP